MQKDIFRAIADPTRRSIIGLLAESSLSIQEIVEHFAMSRPAVAKHIKILTESGIIIVSKQGREQICTLQIEPLKEVHDWVQQYEQFWNRKLDALETYLKTHSGK